MRLIALGLAALAACGSDDRPRAADAPPRPPDAAPRALDAAPAPGSTVTVRVEWKDAPAAVRTSPGRDACGDPRPPVATVHTLHGLADAAVWLAAPHLPPSPVHGTVMVRGCRAEPPVQVVPVGAKVRVTSLDEGRVEAVIRWGETVVARPVLPVVGHTIEMPLERAGVYAVATKKTAEPAWIVAVEGAGAVTDATGTAVIAGVAPGTYEVNVWLRGAAGEPPREAKGEVTVVAGEDAEATISIAPPRGP